MAIPISLLKYKLQRVHNVIKFILTHNQIQFNNVFYTQILGSAMDNTISRILAVIVMHDLENFALSKL